MSFQQSLLYETFFKIINATISDKTIHELEHNLTSIINILNPLPTQNNNVHSTKPNKHKKSIQEFLKKGYQMQLLKHLFSNYSMINQQWNNNKKSKLIFKLILSVHIPPHIIIDSLIS
eukprot:383221_1